jgi:hypothetical protein
MIRMLLPFALLAGCAPTMATYPPLPEPVEITYETEPCFGACPVYRVTVNNLGQPGTFEGKRFTAVEGTRSFPMTYRQFSAFYAALSDARAADSKAYERGGANCQMMATDHPGVSVTFREGQTAPWTFRFYYGCRDRQNAKLAEGLRRAPEALPIADFIGSQQVRPRRKGEPGLDAVTEK